MRGLHFRRRPAHTGRNLREAPEAYHLSSVDKVTFRQLSASALIHRDAVEFGNGMKVRLQELEEGQRLEVQALASEQVGDSEQQFIRRNA